MSPSRIKDRSRLDDHYSRKARAEGYPARSVYKLAELDQTHRLFAAGQSILDLGCAPGGWSLYAAEKVGPGGVVVGLDLKPPQAAFPRQVKIMEADLLSASPDLVADWAPFDWVLSDMAPKTIGRREVDQARSLELCQRAWAWAELLLKPGGGFCFKIFQSQEGDCFVNSLKPVFGELKRLKPQATRRSSQEIFVVLRRYRPGAGEA